MEQQQPPSDRSVTSQISDRPVVPATAPSVSLQPSPTAPPPPRPNPLLELSKRVQERQKPVNPLLELSKKVPDPQPTNPLLALAESGLPRKLELEREDADHKTAVKRWQEENTEREHWHAENIDQALPGTAGAFTIPTELQPGPPRQKPKEPVRNIKQIEKDWTSGTPHLREQELGNILGLIETGELNPKQNAFVDQMIASYDSPELQNMVDLSRKTWDRYQEIKTSYDRQTDALGDIGKTLAEEVPNPLTYAADKLGLFTPSHLERQRGVQRGLTLGQAFKPDEDRLNSDDPETIADERAKRIFHKKERARYPVSSFSGELIGSLVPYGLAGSAVRSGARMFAQNALKAGPPTAQTARVLANRGAPSTLAGYGAEGAALGTVVEGARRPEGAEDMTAEEQLQARVNQATTGGLMGAVIDPAIMKAASALARGGGAVRDRVGEFFEGRRRSELDELAEQADYQNFDDLVDHSTEIVRDTTGERMRLKQEALDGLPEDRQQALKDRVDPTDVTPAAVRSELELAADRPTEASNLDKIFPNAKKPLPPEEWPLDHNLPKNTKAGGTKEISELYNYANSPEGGTQKQSIRYAYVTPEESARLEKDTGMPSMKYWSHVIDTDDMRHAVKKHGGIDEYKRGQIPISAKDFEKVPDIVKNYDSASYAGKDSLGRDLIQYQKRYDDEIYYVEAIRKKKKQLAAKTLWKRPIKIKNGESPQVPGATPDEGVPQTSETYRGQLPDQDYSKSTNAPQAGKSKKPPPGTTLYSNPVVPAAREAARILRLNPGASFSGAVSGGVVGGSTSDAETGSPQWWLDLAAGAAGGAAAGGLASHGLKKLPLKNSGLSGKEGWREWPIFRRNKNNKPTSTAKKSSSPYKTKAKAAAAIRFQVLSKKLKGNLDDYMPLEVEGGWGIGTSHPEHLTPEQVATFIARFNKEGHAATRHGGPDQVTDEQLIKRVLYGIDPASGTIYDAYKKGKNGRPTKHRVGKHATAFTSNKALVKAYHFAKNSKQLRDKVAEAKETGDEYIKPVKIALRDIFGESYKKQARGYTRIGKLNNTEKFIETDFTNGTIRAVFRLGRDDSLKLHTLFIDPQG